MKSFKKTSLVIAAALAGTFIVASPSTAAPSVSNTVMYDTTNGVQIVNGLATLTINTETSTAANVVVSGVGNIVAATAGTNTSISIPVQTNGWYQVTNNGTGAGTSTVMITSAVTGVTTITVTPILSNGTQGTPVVSTVTWTTTGSLLPSTAYTTVYSAAGTATPDATTNAVAVVGPMTAQSAAANSVANIVVSLKDGNNHAISNGTITVTVTGPGLVGVGSTQAGTNMTGRAVTGSAGQYVVNIFGDGTPGVGTFTIYSGTTLLATKTVTFSGSASSYASTNVTKVLKVGSNAGAVTVSVKDAAGNSVANGTTVYAVSDTTSVATIASSAVTTDGVATFAVQGIATGVATLTFKNDATTPTVTTTASVRVGSSTASVVKLEFNSDSYTNGGVVVLTLTAFDAKGLEVADGTYSGLLKADISSSTQLGGATLVGSASPALVGGKATWNLYAPLSAGPFSATATTTTGSVVLEAKSSVTDVNAGAIADSIAAAQEATDAANAAYDAANKAMDSADAATAAAQEASDNAASALAAVTSLANTVATLVAKVNSLAATIAKIAKKVKA